MHHEKYKMFYIFSNCGHYSDIEDFICEHTKDSGSDSDMIYSY